MRLIDSAPFLLALFAVGVLSGATAAVIGFGVGSLLTPLLTLRLSPALAVAVVVASCPNRVMAILCTVLLLLLSVMTIRQTGFWYDDLALWRHNIAVNPNSGLAHLNYGSALYRGGDMPSAEHHFREAIRIDSDDAAAYDNLAMVMIRTGRKEQAVEYINRVVEISQKQSSAARAKLESTRRTLRQAEQQIQAELQRPEIVAKVEIPKEPGELPVSKAVPTLQRTVPLPSACL